MPDTNSIEWLYFLKKLLSEDLFSFTMYWQMPLNDLMKNGWSVDDRVSVTLPDLMIMKKKTSRTMTSSSSPASSTCRGSTCVIQ